MSTVRFYQDHWLEIEKEWISAGAYMITLSQFLTTISA